MTRPSPRSGGNTRGGRSGFGSVRKLPSGRVQARHTGPDGLTHTAPTTFSTKGDAEAWLSIQRAAITLGKWRPASQESQTTFAEYAEIWLRDRDLKPRTRAHYRQLLDKQLLPRFGSLRPASITPDAVRDWHARTGVGTPTLRAHCYSLLRAILTTAVQDGLLPANPCHIRGAGNAKAVHKIRPASVPELEALVSAMPARYQVMTLLAAWCGLRFGELTELRRKDVDLSAGALRVRRAVSRVDGEYVIGAPKSEAGVRDVAVPPHLLPGLRDHLHSTVGSGRDALLFPAAGDASRHLAPASLYKVFYRARSEAGRPDLRWHDLRHTGAVLAAQTGATLAELMGRLGHSTPQAALRYQHVAGGRDAQIAAALSRIASGNHPQ
ncbi:tyrosine-type recombinase/integrase [Ornithinimicrobium sp. LYQ103]|uniref:tyrosine-type recombinase/integrase n=1 Tax=Ornithinimicrobium sp. LYQ103 TaxID=3378796 RepID=UPI0038555A57